MTAAAVPPAPTANVDDTVDVLHGVEVPDPYRWLENGDAPETKAWAAAQEARTRAVLDAVGSRPRLHARLSELLAVGQSMGPAIGGDRLFSLDRWGDHQQAVLVLRGVDDPGPPEPRVVLDPAELLGDDTAALDWYHPSRDGRFVAFGTSTGGSEHSVLRVLDVDSGKLLADEIADTRACSVAWEADGSGFVYTRYPVSDQYHRHVRHHLLGADPAGDLVVLGPDDLPDPTAWPAVALSRDGRWLLVQLALGWTRIDLRLLDRSTGTWTTLIEGEEITTALAFDDHRGGLVGVTTRGADRGQVVAVDLADPAADNWSTRIAEDPGAVTDWVQALSGGLLVRRTRSGAAELSWHDPAGVAIAPVQLPGLGDLGGVAVHDDRDIAVIAYTSFTYPPALLRWKPPDGCQRWSGLPGVPDFTGFSVEQVRYPSTDGTEVPMFLVRGPSTPPLDPETRTILTGYGGFGITETPAYSAAITAWCEDGGLYAIAGIRGGLEEGEAWHRAGMREHKQQVFDDFHAAGQWLVDQKLTSTPRLALRGGSNGGLLMGALITQHPELARAVHCGVPLLDMVRFHHFLIAKLWIPEYGDPDVAEEFAWLHAYSPYHRVVEGVCYPAVLITTAEEDSRVDPAHARKFGARLQAATSCGDRHPVLVRIEPRAGHGVGKPVRKQAEEAADVLAFLGWQLDEG